MEMIKKCSPIMIGGYFFMGTTHWVVIRLYVKIMNYKIKIGLQEKGLTLFNKDGRIYVKGEMEVYEYYQDGCKFIKN